MNKDEMEILKQSYQKMVKSFIEIFILGQLRKNSLSGYDVIAIIHKKFDIMLSSGTVYSRLSYMERDGLIKGSEGKKRIYSLTEKGEKIVKVILKEKQPILKFVDELLG